VFKFSISFKLSKKLNKLSKRDKVLVKIFKKKVFELVRKDKQSINTYKNLKAPKHEFKRIHLTDNFILLFRVNIRENHILFVDILHWDFAY